MGGGIPRRGRRVRRELENKSLRTLRLCVEIWEFHAEAQSSQRNSVELRAELANFAYIGFSRYHSHLEHSETSIEVSC
jgi:hypothetical protein